MEFLGKINGKTRLICIIGNPVDHSQSPYMHNLSFEKLKLDYSYMGFNIEKGFVKEAVEAMRVLNVRGFNITMPYKEEVMNYLDEVKEDARLIGSVNTVVNENGKLIGHNTDGKGFIKALEEENIKYKDEKIVILGAGGAARAIAIELALKGPREILIVNRTLKAAEKIRDTINKNIEEARSRSMVLDEELLKEELKDASILVNTTSIGMDETIDKSVIKNIDLFYPELLVLDLIYDPLKTKFLSMAEEKGCKIMNGLDMLIYQGAIGFKLWTGLDMPKEVIEKMKKRDFLEDNKD